MVIQVRPTVIGNIAARPAYDVRLGKQHLEGCPRASLLLPKRQVYSLADLSPSIWFRHSRRYGKEG